METPVQAGEERRTSRIASAVVAIFGISTAVVFLAVAGVESLFRDALPGGPALSLYFITSVFFGVIALSVSSIFWLVSKTPLRRKRTHAAGKKAYSLAAMASLVSLISCVATPLAPILGAVSILNDRRSGGRLSGMGAAHAGIVLGSAVLILFLFMKSSGYMLVRANAEEARRIVRSASTAQSNFKSQLHLDRDGDGVGEYGSVSELHAEGFLRDVPAEEPRLREGYIFTITPARSDPEASFFVSARPLLNWNTPGDRAPLLFTGDRCFYIDESGILWQNQHRRATEYMTAAELATNGWTVVEDAPRPAP